MGLRTEESVPLISIYWSLTEEDVSWGECGHCIVNQDRIIIMLTDFILFYYEYDILIK